MSSDKNPNQDEDFEKAIQEMLIIQAPQRALERKAVQRLGDSIGYGNLMSLASSIWAGIARKNGTDGSNFTVGPCASGCATCPHEFDETERFLDANGHCDWCCGAGWVTKRVAEEMERQKPKS